jgi:hypothetical protein
VNLTNLKRSCRPSDDLIVLAERAELCPCGRPHLPMAIACHHRNRVVDARGEPADLMPLHCSLKCHYANLQFHQDQSDRVCVFYSSMDDPLEDLVEVENYLGRLGLETEFVPNKYYFIGRKRYRAWRSLSAESKEFKMPQKGTK